jgi:hypothetical protein
MKRRRTMCCSAIWQIITIMTTTTTAVSNKESLMKYRFAATAKSVVLFPNSYWTW